MRSATARSARGISRVICNGRTCHLDDWFLNGICFVVINASELCNGAILSKAICYGSGTHVHRIDVKLVYYFVIYGKKIYDIISKRNNLRNYIYVVMAVQQRAALVYELKL